MGQDETQRPDDMRCRVEQHFALDQRLPHQAELVVLEVAQATVDQLARGAGGGRGEVGLLAEEDLEPATGGVGGDAGAIDAATDDGEVEEGAAVGGKGVLAGHGGPGRQKYPVTDRDRKRTLNFLKRK